MVSIDDVVQLVSLFRVKAANRPLWLFLALLIAFAAVARLPAAWPAVEGRTRRLAWGLAVLALAWYLATVVWYVGQEQYVDYAEPTMAAVGWLFAVGRPVYHALDSPERYSHMYGPLAFAIPGWFLAWLGPSIAVSKASGAVAGLVGLGIVYRLVCRAGARHSALIFTGLFAVLCFAFRHLSFWVRPDSFVLLFASWGLLAAVASRAPVAAIGLGLAAGVLVNLKLTGPLYVLPAFALVALRFGPAAFLSACVIAAVAAAVPFVVFDNVSFTNYLLWVRVSATNGLEFWTLRQNVEWALFLLVPLAPLLLARPQTVLPPRAFRALLIGLALGLVGVVVAASKPGAGPYHLMPFLPVIVYILALHQARPADASAAADAAPSHLPLDLRPIYRRGCAAFVGAASLVAVAQQTYFFQLAHLNAGLNAADDIERFADAHPGARIAMGASDDDEHLTLARPVLVFRDARYLIDVPAIQEYQMSGLDLPPATLRAVRDCVVDIWLIPRNGHPFATKNNYPTTGYRELFPEAFRQAFFAAYERVGSTRLYQIWQCRRASSK